MMCSILHIKILEDFKNSSSYSQLSLNSLNYNRPEVKTQPESERPTAEEAEAEAVGIEGIATLEASLRPVEKYAVRWVEQVATCFYNLSHRRLKQRFMPPDTFFLPSESSLSLWHRNFMAPLCIIL